MNKTSTIRVTAVAAALLVTSLFACKKESRNQTNKINKVASLDKDAITKNIKSFATFVKAKKLEKIGKLGINAVAAPDNENYGQEYMTDSYGTDGAAAYIAPATAVQTAYNPVPLTTAADVETLAPTELSQKVNSDLNQYFDISGLMTASQASSAVQGSVNDLSAKLETLATSEVGGYIDGTSDTTNFSEDAIFASVKVKTAAVFNEYMSNVGNQVLMTPSEQIVVLAASYNASQLVDAVDFRSSVSAGGQLASQSLNKLNAIHVNGFFSKLVKIVKAVAKVVAAVVVSAVVIVGAAVVGGVAGLVITALGDSNSNGQNTFAQIDALGGALWGYDKIAKSNLWKWALS